MFHRHVVVVEDESLLRDLIAKTLETNGFQVTTAANAADAARVFKATDPDAVVLDVELGPGPNGFDFAESLHKTAPDVGIVFLTNLPDARFAGRETKDLPTNISYLRKSQLIDSGELVKALEAVLHDSITPDYRHDLASDRPLRSLSKKQISVLQLLAMGYTNSQIAEKRGTTVRAVENLFKRAIEAAGIEVGTGEHGRVLAVRKYIETVVLPKN